MPVLYEAVVKVMFVKECSTSTNSNSRSVTCVFVIRRKWNDAVTTRKIFTAQTFVHVIVTDRKCINSAGQWKDLGMNSNGTNRNCLVFAAVIFQSQLSRDLSLLMDPVTLLSQVTIIPICHSIVSYGIDTPCNFAFHNLHCRVMGHTTM